MYLPTRYHGVACDTIYQTEGPSAAAVGKMMHHGENVFCSFLQIHVFGVLSIECVGF